MAIGDIYYVQAHFEAPTSGASFGLYYRETALFDQGALGTDQIAKSWENAFAILLRDVLSDDWNFTAITAEKRIVNAEPKRRVDQAVQAGSRSGPALPANNAIHMELLQGTFSARSNGRIFIPGIAESDTDVGVLVTAFVTTQLAALRDALTQLLTEESGGSGRWELGVISTKVLNAAPPAKDWAGAFAPVIGAVGHPIIATQRRRETRAIGASV